MKYLTAIKSVKTYTFPCYVNVKDMESIPNGIRYRDEKTGLYVFDGKRAKRNKHPYRITILNNPDMPAQITIAFPLIDQRERD